MDRTTYHINRQGTHQSDRYNKALEPSYIPIDERKLHDFVEQMAQYAKQLHFYNEQNQQEGDWTTFFEEIYDYELQEVKFGSLAELEATASSSPHLAIILSFLQLYLEEIQILNTLTEKHLTFYYQELLQLKKKEARQDKAIIAFEAEKNAAPIHVPANSKLVAYHDKAGKEVLYSTLTELSITQASVEQTLNIDKKTGQSNTSDKLHISSPLFHMQEGRRRITIVFNTNFSLPVHIKAEYSSPEGWVQAKNTHYSRKDTNTSFLTISIGRAQAPCCHNSNLLPTINTSQHPTLRFSINEDNKHFYKEFHPALIQKIVTSVDGVKKLFLQNDLGKLDHNKSFQPFGSIPKKNISTLLIGHKDIFNKYLTSFHLAMHWKGAPKKALQKQYAAYNQLLQQHQQANYISRETAYGFTHGHVPAQLDILDDGRWKRINMNSPHHFTQHRENYNNKYYTPNLSDTAPITEEIKHFDTAFRSGFIRLRLNIDFGHDIYPELIKLQSYDLSSNAKETYKPIPKPYTPEFNSLHIDYEASTYTDFECLYSNELGYKQLKEASIESSTGIDLWTERETIIGIKDVDTPSVLHLFIDLDSPHTYIDSIANNTLLQILDNNQWRAITKEELIQNSTISFTQSGILQLYVPNINRDKQTLMPNNRLWIKISIRKNSQQYPAIKKVTTHVTEAVCELEGRDLEHLDKGLAAGTINRLQHTIKGIKSITQIGRSYGGHRQENTPAFHQRISERLRHKNKAWNAWDIEHMLLAQFPNIAYAKVLAEASTPGLVNIMAIPSHTQYAGLDTQKKYLNPKEREDIRHFLKAHSSPFASIKLVQPVYEDITIVCNVVLHKSYHNAKHYKDVLNKSLIQLFDPFQQDGSLIKQRDTFYLSTIISFIERLEYIDWIKDISAYRGEHLFDNNEAFHGTNENAIIKSATTHKITISHG